MPELQCCQTLIEGPHVRAAGLLELERLKKNKR